MVNPGNKSAQYALIAIFTVGSVLLALPPSAESANILFFLGFGSPSHRMAMDPLANALVAKGHNVTFLLQEMPKSGNDPRIQYFIPKKLAEFFIQHLKVGAGGVGFYNIRASGKGPWASIFTQSFGIKVCEFLYTDPQFVDWLHSGPDVDLVILDSLFNECGYGVAHALGAKTMMFSVSTMLPWNIEGVGMPDESSWIPDVMSHMPLDMNFGQRMFTAVSPVLWRLYRLWFIYPKIDKITREALKQDKFPSTEELEKNLSLVLLNTHPAQEPPRSLPPNVIPVGGMSWKDSKKSLPEKMEKFINEGKEGFIYVSFGSFIDFLTFPEEVQQTFISALKEFPNIQFIWKLNKTPENLPKHILVEKWMPQQELLTHPKIRAFITHSGIGGVTEAIHSGVPMICFPVLTEQDYNAFSVEKKGFGIKMEITKLTKQDMVNAINKMITDKSYKETAQKVRNQFMDRPARPVDTAVWWTEYVLRQEDTSFLRSQNVEQSWWRKRQLDVWLFILLLTITFNSLGLYVAYRIFKRCFKSKAGSKTKTGKQKQN